MSPGQNVTQEVRAKRHPVGQGKTSQGNMSQGNMSPRAKRLRAECHPTTHLMCVCTFDAWVTRGRARSQEPLF